MAARRLSLERVRITRVGVGFVFLTLLVGFAAVNTGNNALYLVEAMLLALLVVSGLASRRNLRHLEIELRAPAEVYANRPFSLAYRLVSADRWTAKRWLTLSAREPGSAELVPYLAPRGERSGRLNLALPRRGPHRLESLRVASIFPLGVFYKVMRAPTDLEILVYPEIFPVALEPSRRTGSAGGRPARRPGQGHELLSLRGFREGDDPRGIHWKQTARSGGLIFMEREIDEGRRLSVQLDNGVGRLEDEAAAARFERLVSEAASAAVQHLKSGWAVELVTRTGVIGFGRGRRQKVRILEALARVEAVAPVRSPLRSSDPSAPVLRFGFDTPRRAIA